MASVGSRRRFVYEMPDGCTGLMGMFTMANEPSFHIPYLYNYAGAPWKTQRFVRRTLDCWFRNDKMGMCGDKDGGGMSAFAVFSMMGFYPVTPGLPEYQWGSPVFRTHVSPCSWAEWLKRQSPPCRRSRTSRSDRTRARTSRRASRRTT